MGRKDKIVREWVFKNRTKDIIDDDTSDIDGFDDKIIADDIVDEARAALTNEGVSNEDTALDDDNNRDVDHVRNKILADAATSMQTKDCRFQKKECRHSMLIQVYQFQKMECRSMKHSTT